MVPIVPPLLLCLRRDPLGPRAPDIFQVEVEFKGNQAAQDHRKQRGLSNCFVNMFIDFMPTLYFFH